MTQPIIQWLDVRTAAPDDLAALVAHEHRMEAERVPDDLPVPLEERVASWRNSPDFLDLGCWVIRDDDAIIANAWTEIWDTGSNPHAFDVHILVEPPYRRRGLARALLAKAVAWVEPRGRTLMLGWTTDRVPAGEPFMRRLGAESGLKEGESQLDLREVDRALLAAWRQRGEANSARYDLDFYEGIIPDDALDAMLAFINVAYNSEPRGDLALEDELWTPDRFRQVERNSAARGRVRWTFVVRERASGAVIGDTELYWYPTRPMLARQGFTGVLSAHRNRGLGRWLKAVMMEKVLRDLPEVHTIRTGHADSNAPMRKINEELGYRPFSSDTQWQITLGEVRAYLEMR